MGMSAYGMKVCESESESCRGHNTVHPQSCWIFSRWHRYKTVCICYAACETRSDRDEKTAQLFGLQLVGLGHNDVVNPPGCSKAAYDKNRLQNPDNKPP